MIDDWVARGIDLLQVDLVGRGGTNDCNDQRVPKAAFVNAVHPELDGRGLQLLLEPGRSTVGDIRWLLTCVEFFKPGETKKVALIDAAMNDLIRPTLYDAWYPVEFVVARAGGSVGR